MFVKKEHFNKTIENLQSNITGNIENLQSNLNFLQNQINNLEMKLNLLIDSKYQTENKNKKKILCLHGGNGSIISLSRQKGMQDLQSSFLNDDYTFEFLSASDDNTNDTWWDDPPSKDKPTNDENWANKTIKKINDKIKNDGPYYALLGYSQGASAIIVWDAFNRESNNQLDIKKLILFCGYLPETHLGLMNVINRNVLSETKCLIFIGQNDKFFYELGLDIKTKFNNYLELIDPNVGHNLPINTDQTYNEVIKFITSTNI